MAIETAAFSSYSAIGNREDLADKIYNVDPTDTPFMSGVDKVKAMAVKHEWQTQALATAATNDQLEGDAFTTVAATATSRLNNYCQISGKYPRVTGTQMAIDHAGRDDEMAYQEMLKGMELKRDMEVILIGTNRGVTTGSTTAARKTASVLSWLVSNTDKPGGGGAADPTSPADGTTSRTDGTTVGTGITAFTEARLKNVLQKIWTSGGKPDTILVGAFNKQALSTFTGRATPTEDTRAKKITAAVTAYESDFGVLTIAADRFQRARDVFALQMDMWGIAYLRKFVSTDIAKTGDSIAKAVLSEYALEARNEKASGGVFDCTTT
jgi:hypothetical protein